MKSFRKTMLLLTFVFSVVLLGGNKLTANAETTITPINTNTDVIGTIPEKGDLFYSFTTTKSGYFTYSLSHPDIGESGSFYISILNSDQVVLDSSTGKSITSNVWSCVPGMTYYFKVTNNSGSRGQKFKLRVNEVAEANWERESNNTQATATPIAFNTTIKGVISGDKDSEDWYKVTIDKAGYFEPTLNHADIAQTGSYRVDVYEASGKRIAYGASKTIAMNRKSYNVGSVMYIKVSNNSGSRFQPYELKVNFVASDAYESEGNGDQASADPVSFGKKYYGMIGEYEDAQDWFVFNNPKDAVVTLTFGPNDVASKGTWKVCMVDARGKEQSVYVDSVTKNIPMKIKKGKFYIKVVNSAGAREKLYAFSLARKNYAITGNTEIKGIKTAKTYFGNTVVKQVKLSKKAKYATNYEIKIAKNKKVKRPVYKTTTKASKKLAASGSLKKGKYYVQVRPYLTDLFGNRWYGKKSNVYEFKAK